MDQDNRHEPGRQRTPNGYRYGYHVHPLYFRRVEPYISFSPAWDTYKQEWSIDGNRLTIGYDTYTIETLTDTSLTIYQLVTLSAFRCSPGRPVENWVVWEFLSGSKVDNSFIGISNIL